MILDPGFGWPLLALLPFLAVGVVIAILNRRPPLWRRIVGGVLAGLAAFIVAGAIGYLRFAQTTGFDANAAVPAVLVMVLCGGAVGALAVVALRWRLSRAR